MRSVLRFFAFVTAVVAAFGSRPSSAATRVVTTLDDSSPQGLSATVAAAAAGDVVTFAPGLTGEIVLSASPLSIAVDLTIAGPGAHLLSIRPGAQARAVAIGNARVTLSELALLPPATPSPGGGIHNGGDLTLWRVRISDSDASSSGGRGGAIENQGGLTMRECEISSCAAGLGGGIYTAAGSRLELWASTLAGNAGGRGGGLHAETAEVRLVNSTVSNNWADFGGGVQIVGGSLSIVSSTIVDNATSGQISGTAGVGVTGADVTVRNSVIAKNLNYHFGLHFDIDCCWTDLGFNLVGNASGPIDPMLDPLASAGGFAPVRVPQPGSPVVDRGHASGFPWDERLFHRPFDDAGVANAPGGDGSDIGAVEAGSSVLGIGPTSAGSLPRITSIVPNPMRSTTTVSFALPRSGPIRLIVLSVDGRRIRTLATGWHGAGPALAAWDGRDHRGVTQPPGAYVAQLEAAGTRVARRFIRL